MKKSNSKFRRIAALLMAFMCAGGITGVKADFVLSYQSTSSHSDSGAEEACSGLSSGDSCSWSTYSVALYCSPAETLCCWWKPEADPNGIPNNRTDWTGTCGTGPNGRTTCNNVTSVEEPGVSYGRTYGASCPPSGS